MQKRARAVETQKLRRTFKARTRIADQDGMSSGLAYLRLCLLWLTMISLDVLVGFRFELLWPFWLFLRAIFEAVHRSGNAVVALSNHNNAQMSIIFICVTATSDLICWLFIPVRFLIFIASTYVWLNLVWHTNGGFVRTVSSMLADRSQGAPIIFLWGLFIFVEVSVRLRCDYLALSRDGPLGFIFGVSHSQLVSCHQVQGMAPVFPRVMNEFFGAHCIGYPLVIISFSLRYYFKEWRLRRKQEDVAKKNEVLYKCLTEALPAVYEGPKQYRLEAESLDYELNGPTDVPMLLPATNANGVANGALSSAAPSSGGTTTTANNRKTSIRPAGNTTTTKGRKRKEKQDGITQRTPPEARAGKQEASSQITNATTAGNSPCWEENSRRGGLIQMLWSGFHWMVMMVQKLTESPADAEDASSYNDEDEEDDDSSIEDDDNNKKRTNRNQMENTKQRATTTAAQGRKKGGGGQNKSSQQAKASSQTQADEKGRANGSTPAAASPLVVASAISSSLTNGHAKREDSVDHKNRRTDSRGPSRETINEETRENNNHAQGCDVELSRVRTELRQAKDVEADLRLQLSVSENDTTRAKAEATQFRSRLEQLQARFGSVEKVRDQERTSAGQLEKKYAELMNRKNDVEKELQAERRQRQEDNNKNKNRSDISQEQREKEARLEAEADRLRTECAAKDDALMTMQRDLQQLREYKEKNDVEGLHMELRIVREKNAHLEDALAAENKLKLELFRALGEAKSENHKLQGQLESARAISAQATPPQAPTNPSPPLRVAEKALPLSHASVGGGSGGMAPPSYDHIMAASYMNNMPYSFASSPAPSPTGEHHLFDTHSPLGMPRPPSGSSAEYSLNPISQHFGDKFGSHLLAPGKTTN
ncbi:unnamed protein product, partial [Mesorhabditis belari]|uniref:Macoilin n=1 Tax=Mesorhabditis belari TaxID=2138241 RepID=A0AAF3EIU2_9BILA